MIQFFLCLRKCICSSLQLQLIKFNLHTNFLLKTFWFHLMYLRINFILHLMSSIIYFHCRFGDKLLHFLIIPNLAILYFFFSNTILEQKYSVFSLTRIIYDFSILTVRSATRELVQSRIPIKGIWRWKGIKIQFL